MTEEQQDLDQVRSMTIEALDAAPVPLAELRRIFDVACEAFEAGEDVEGMETLQGALPGLGEFTKFCATLMVQTQPLLPGAIHDELATTCARFQQVIASILAECEGVNYTEVSDLLRYEATDLMKQYDDLFARMSEALKADAPQS